VKLKQILCLNRHMWA